MTDRIYIKHRKDPSLHADLKKYSERNGMTMAQAIRERLDAKDFTTVHDMDNPTDRARQRGAGKPVIERTMALLMQANDAIPKAAPGMPIHPDMLYLSASAVQQASRTDKRRVLEYFHEHKEEIDAHNIANGFLSPLQGREHNKRRARPIREEIDFLKIKSEWEALRKQKAKG